MLFNFTSSELERLKNLQEVELEKYNSLYNWDNYKGRPLIEETVILFLNKYVEKFESMYGKDSIEYLNAVSTRDNKYKRWKNGEVIDVDTVTGEFLELSLYSDGTVRESVWKS